MSLVFVVGFCCSTKSFNTGAWPTSLLKCRLSKAVSSKNLIIYPLGRVLLQSFVHTVNKRGDKTHPWGEPVETTFTLEVEVEPVEAPHKKIKYTYSQFRLKF